MQIWPSWERALCDITMFYWLENHACMVYMLFTEKEDNDKKTISNHAFILESKC